MQNHAPAEGPWLVFLIQDSREEEVGNRNAEVLKRLRDLGAGTLVLNLLPDGREASDPEEIHALLQVGSRRAVELLDGLRAEGREPIRLGIFGSGFGGAVALKVAGERPGIVKAVVCTEGPGDPRKEFFSKLRIPTLFLSGPTGNGRGQGEEAAENGRGQGEEAASPLWNPVHEMYEAALAEMDSRISLDPCMERGSWLLFQEEGKAEEVTRDAWVWFQEHLFPEGQPPDTETRARLGRTHNARDVDADGPKWGQKGPGNRESPPEDRLFLRLPPGR